MRLAFLPSAQYVSRGLQHVLLSRRGYRWTTRVQSRAASKSKSNGIPPSSPTDLSTDNRATEKAVVGRAFRGQASASETHNALDPTKRIFYENKELAFLCRVGDVLGCLRIATRIKESKELQPNNITYLHLIRALINGGYYREASQLFNELAEDQERGPDLDICNEILKGNVHAGEDLYEMIEIMESNGIQPNDITREHMLAHILARKQIELAIYRSTTENELTFCTFKSGERLSRACVDVGEIVLAENIHHRLGKDENGTVSPETSMHILRGAAASSLKTITRTMWRTVVGNDLQSPDEGTCLAVLQCARAHNDIALANVALRVLKSTGCQFQGHHLSPILEIHLRKGDVPSAIRFVQTMQKLQSSDLDTAGISKAFRQLLLEKWRPSTESLKLPWASDASLAERVRSMQAVILASPPAHYSIITAMIESACEADERLLAQTLLQQADQLLGSDVRPELAAYLAIIHHAMGNGAIEEARALLDVAQRSGHGDDTALLEAQMRLTLSRIPANPEPSLLQRALRNALDALDDLKNLERPGVPSRMAYLWVCRALAQHNDPRLEAIAREMLQANYILPEKEIRSWDPAIAKRLALAIRRWQMGVQQVPDELQRGRSLPS